MSSNTTTTSPLHPDVTTYHQPIVPPSTNESWSHPPEFMPFSTRMYCTVLYGF